MKKALLVVIAITVIFSAYLSFAATDPQYGFNWVRGKSLDNFFKETTRTEKDEVMLNWDITDINTYTLSYNLEDGEETIITINKRNQDLDFKYQVYRLSDNEEITKTNYIDVDFEEWNFIDQIYAKPAVLPETSVTYTINKTDTRTGKIFIIKNQIVKFYWDTTKNQAYFVTTGLKKGNIHSFDLKVNSSLVKNIDILKQLGIEAKATHWVMDPVDGLVDKDIITKTLADTDETGLHPGLQLQIDRPKVWSTVDKKFVSISTDQQKLFKLTFNIKQKPISGSSENPPSAQYNMILYNMDEVNSTATPLAPTDPADPFYTIKAGKYDVGTGKYILDIVKDDPLDARFIKWSELNYSTIYDNISVIMANASGATYEYDTEYSLSQDVNYAATYLNYTIERKNIDDSYIVIKPYDTKGIYDIYYANSKIEDQASPSLKLWSSHATEAGSEPCYIPVDITNSESGTQYYTFKVDYRITEESPVISSQLLIYDANADTIFNPPVPEMKQVKDLIIVPPIDENSNEPEKLSFKVVWDKSDKIINLLGDNKVVWFEVYLNSMIDDYTDPDQSSNNQHYQIAKVIYMRKEGSDIQLSFDNDFATFTTFDMNKDDFEMEITLKDSDRWYRELNPSWDGQGGDLTKPTSSQVGEYEEATDPNSYENNFFNPGKEKIPGNYFLMMRAYYDSDINDQNNELTVSDLSVPISVYLDMREEMLNIPSNIKQQSVTDSFFNLIWDDVNIDTYKQYMLDPMGYTVDSTGYEVFISESADNINALLNDENIKKKVDIEGQLIDNLEYIALNDPDSGDSVTEMCMDPIAYPTYINSLRDGKVLAFKIDDNQVKVSSLEPNVVYYVAIRTRIDMHDTLTPTITGNRFSGLSTIIPITILKDAPIPDDSEKTPPAPENLELDGTPNDLISLNWTQPIITSNPGETIGYDIVRIGSFPIKDTHNNTDIQIADIFADTDYKDLQSWQVRLDELYIYDKQTSSWAADEDDDLTFNSNTSTTNFKDTHIAANQIYYYYVRTVRVNQTGDALSNSSWTYISVTTNPIAPPINLRTNSKDYQFDSYKEVVIQFDAPITDETKIPSQYEFGIAVKSQDESAYTETRDGKAYSATSLAVLDNASVGYKKYVYRITGLTSGKKYSIKVRVFDKTKGTLSDGRYPASNYSNVVEARTQFNQDDYDKENKYKAYLDYYREKAAEILKERYWVLKNTDNINIKYKSDVLCSQLDLLNNNIYDLDGKVTNKTTEYVYYIPSACIKKLNEKEINLRLIRGNTQVIIPPNILSEVYTDKLANVVKAAKNSSSDVKDYYIRLTIKFTKDSSTIAGNKPISDDTDVKFEVISLEVPDDEIDSNIKIKYDEIVTQYEADILDAAESALDEDSPDTAFNESLTETLGELRKDLADDSDGIVQDSDTKTDVITSTYNPFIIQITELSGNVHGYKYTNSKWEEQELIKYLSQAYINVKDSTKYVFTSDDNSAYKSINSDNAAAIINVYDRFRLNGAIDLVKLQTPKNSITSAELEKVMIKAVGIKSQDEFERLQKEQELKNSLDLTEANPTKAQTIYNVMKLYEKMTGTKINNMFIKDYTVFDYIQNVKDKYKRSVIAANELGIIQIANFNPNSQTSYEDLFMYLNEISE